MVSGDFLIWWNAITVRKGREKVFHIFLNVFLVSVFTKGFGYLLCWPRGRGIGLVCKRRFSFHEFYNFLLFNFLIFISFWKIARCGSQVQPTKMTLVRQRVLSSSEVRASDLEHGGSWVRIPSGAQIFSVSSYGWFFTSPFYFLYNIRFFTHDNYPHPRLTPTTDTHDPRPLSTTHDISYTPKLFMRSCLFIVCKTMFTIGESQAISLANRTANTRTPILGRSVGPGENARRKFSSIGGRAPDSHRTISKRLSECWLLIGHKKCFASLCPIGEQHLTTTNTKNMTFKRPYFYL